MRPRLILLVLATALTLPYTRAQEPAAGSFEVASIKPANPSNLHQHRITGGPGTDSPGQLICLGVTLKQLVLHGHGIQDYQLFGPAWLDNDQYDIIVRIPPGSTREQTHRMIQIMLAERFGMRVHKESRELSIYVTRPAKGGLKLKESEALPGGDPVSLTGVHESRVTRQRDKDGVPELMPGIRGMMAFPVSGYMRISARMQPIANLFSMLHYQIDRPVVDGIGLSGNYDFKLDYSPASTGPSPEPAPSLFAALEKQLGIKLVPRKGPVEVLVIDHVDRVPTPN